MTKFKRAAAVQTRGRNACRRLSKRALLQSSEPEGGAFRAHVLSAVYGRGAPRGAPARADGRHLGIPRTCLACRARSDDGSYSSDLRTAGFSTVAQPHNGRDSHSFRSQACRRPELMQKHRQRERIRRPLLPQARGPKHADGAQGELKAYFSAIAIRCCRLSRVCALSRFSASSASPAQTASAIALCSR